jgi:hypothetical protein
MGAVGSCLEKCVTGSSALEEQELMTSSYEETRKGYPDTLTAPQREAMAQVRRELASAGILGAPWDDDHDMCRWLRARKFDVAATLLMIRNHVQWKKDFDVDNVYANFAHPPAAAAEIKAAYPRAYHRTDRVGRPINIDCVGRLNIKRINQLVTMEDLVKEKVQEMVRAGARPEHSRPLGPFWRPIGTRGPLTCRAPPALRHLQEYTIRVRYPECSRAAGRKINQSVVIMDLGGLSMSIWSSKTREVLKTLIGVLSDHYPETMGVLFIVNAPSFFAGIFSFVKLFLDPGTVQKINVLSTSQRHELFKIIDPASLPPFLGGTDESFSFEAEQGPWIARESETTRSKPATRGLSFGGLMVPTNKRRSFICCGAPVQ